MHAKIHTRIHMHTYMLAHLYTSVCTDIYTYIYTQAHTYTHDAYPLTNIAKGGKNAQGCQGWAASLQRNHVPDGAGRKPSRLGVPSAASCPQVRVCEDQHAYMYVIGEEVCVCAWMCIARFCVACVCLWSEGMNVTVFFLEDPGSHHDGLT